VIILVGVSFGGGTGGGVWLLVSTASAALYVHYSVYVLEPVNAESADELPFSLRHHNMQTFLQIWQISRSSCPLLSKQRAFISSKALHSTQLKALSP
jgi:hypothetical protein